MFENCSRCGLFTKILPNGLCPSCQHEDERLLDEAQNVIAQTGKITASELAEILDVSIQRIFDWLKSRKLNPTSLIDRCPACGKVLTGLTCDCQQNSFFRKPEEIEKTPDKFHCPIRRDRRIHDYWCRRSNIRTSQRRTFWIHELTTAG